MYETDARTRSGTLAVDESNVVDVAGTTLTFYLNCACICSCIQLDGTPLLVLPPSERIAVSFLSLFCPKGNNSTAGKSVQLMMMMSMYPISCCDCSYSDVDNVVMFC